MGILHRFSPAAVVVVSAFSLGFPRGAVAQPKHEKSELIRGRNAAAGEVLVNFRQSPFTVAPVDEPDVDRDEALGQGRWRLIHSRSRSAAELTAAMRRRSDVVFAEPNYQVSADGSPNDLVPPLWALSNTGQTIGDGTTGIAGADIGAVRAWDTTTGSRGVVVATIDTGVLATHPDLAANVWSAPSAFSVTLGGVTISCAAGTHGFNAIARTCVPDDDNGHGTHVAGSIGAVGGNGTGVVGVNWATSIMAVKFLDAGGNGYVSDAIDAIEFAIQAKRAFGANGGANVRVLNNSWSGGDYSQALADEIQRAADNDMLFVAAAGNHSADSDTQPTYPSAYTGANLVAVGATDDRDQLSSFSDFGAHTVHLGAPGTSIYSTYISPDGKGSGSYSTLNGTSMAAAYVSGAAALVLSHCSYSTGALRNALLTSAAALPSLDGRIESSRRLNAARAVESCTSLPAAGELLITAADIPAGSRHGAWASADEVSAAGGLMLATPDAGWASTTAPLAAPTDYVDVTFSAPADVPYRLWVRLRAKADSKWNDSVWAQFSDALVDGVPAYAINTANGLIVNLENCSGCGVSGWGWQDGAYWLDRPTVTFSSSGPHTLRLQAREDGVEFDQIVLSPSTYLFSSPGQVENDATILSAPASGPSTTSDAPPPSSGATAFVGSAIALPGTVVAANFDNGGEGLAYHDVSPGNSGGAYRNTDVDVEPSSEGGYSVGWISAGEWLRYSVNVSAAGDYVASIRVASPSGGGSLRLVFDGNGMTAQIAVPATGDWQNWTTVDVPVTLAAGAQGMQLMFDTGGFNVRAVTIATNTTTNGLSPYNGSPRALPGVVQAAEFDNGGEGVAYHDATPGNTGDAFRASDVDLAASSEGGYTVGWIDAGEWVNYTVNVPAAGSYTLRLRVAAPDAGGALHVGFNGPSNVWNELAVPATGGWQQWTTITTPVVLGAGPQQITLYFDTAGYNVSWLSVDAP